jgi:glutamyl/glutaminyl-tRNA synthetase
MNASVADMCGKMAKMEEENKAYMAENEELKKFKADEEGKQFAFAVDSTLKEIEDKVEIPASDREFLLEESKKFNLETIDGWKNLARAKAFDFAKKDKKEDGGVKRYALPWGAKEDNLKKPLWVD